MEKLSISVVVLEVNVPEMNRGLLISPNSLSLLELQNLASLHLEQSAGTLLRVVRGRVYTL